MTTPQKATPTYAPDLSARRQELLDGVASRIALVLFDVDLDGDRLTEDLVGVEVRRIKTSCLR